MPDKLTDNEIVKALEEWRKEIIADYQRLQLLDAPMDCFEESHADTVTKLSNILDLINRLQAENERLKSPFIKMYEQFEGEIKAEAYKECIEKVKEKSCKLNMCHNDVAVKTDYQISGENLDNLLKELVGENK